MNEEYLVAQLADRASKVLLVLLFLARKSDTAAITSSQLTSLTGARSSQFNALAQLVEAGIVEIIPQPGQPCLVRLARAAFPCGTITTGANFPLSSETLLIDSASDASLLEACRLADDAGPDRKAQIAALRRVWDKVFPNAEYPYQRLTDDAAKRFLAGDRTAQAVAQVILDAKAHARESIKAPRSYIEVALSSIEKRRGGREAAEAAITDELRQLAKIGRNQYAKNS